MNSLKTVNQGFKRNSSAVPMEALNLEDFLEACLDVFFNIKEKIRKKIMPDKKFEDVLSESEFFEETKRLDFEQPGKSFEKYCSILKTSEEKYQKVVKISSFAAMVFDNTLIDLKNLNILN